MARTTEGYWKNLILEMIFASRVIFLLNTAKTFLSPKNLKFFVEP